MYDSSAWLIEAFRDAWSEDPTECAELQLYCGGFECRQMEFP
jgi:hypothetical protein